LLQDVQENNRDCATRAPGHAPENTSVAFARAIKPGAHLSKTDVQVTRDGHLVLFQNHLVERTCNGQEPVANNPLAKQRGLDSGIWHASPFSGRRIVTPVH